MKKQTTKKDFEIFKDECLHWIDFFGLKAWNFYFVHRDCKDLQNVLAYILHPSSIEDRVFTIGLPLTASGEHMNADNIRKSAFHEVMEALLFRLGYFAKARFPAREDIDEEMHAVIRTLENSIFPALRKSKKL